MPRNFLVKRRAPTDEGAWPDDDVIASPLPVSSHESPDSGYCAHSPLDYVRDEPAVQPSRDAPHRDVTSGLPPSLMTSSAAVLRTATNIYQQLMLRRRAETILAAAAKTGNGSVLSTGSGSLLGTGIGSSAALFPVCSLPLAPYLIPAALGNGAVAALNLSNKTIQPDEPTSAITADDTGQMSDRCSYTLAIINETEVILDICKAPVNTIAFFQSAQIWRHTFLHANRP